MNEQRLDEIARLQAEHVRYRDALERIAGPTDRPFLGFDGRLAGKALDRPPADPEAVAARAKRDYDHYVDGIPLLKPSGHAPRPPENPDGQEAQ